VGKRLSCLHTNYTGSWRANDEAVCPAMTGCLSKVAADNALYWPKGQYENFLIAVNI
jgi:hypothetical protein